MSKSREENTRDESIRSDTTDTDWIRDWPFNSWDKSEQDHLYNNWKDHWKKIEEKFQISPDWIGYFIYDYVILQNDSLEYSQHNLKGRLEKLLKTEKNLETMQQYADFYVDYVLANDPDYNPEFKEHRNLRLTGYTPAILIMKLRDLLESEKLDEETYKKMLSLLESYRIRLAVVKEPNHWEIFYKMTPLICENDPLKSFLDAMEKMKEEDSKYEFPNDKDLCEKLKEINFYGGGHLSYDWCRLILYRLQDYNAGELSPMVEHFEIEHVMPYTYNDNWKNVPKADHDKWVNNIGNLTLVPSLNLNQQLSAKKFEEKKKIADSYIKVANRFRLDDSVWGKEKWTIDEIEERREALAKKAKCIWPDLYEKS